ncbi:MAG: low specificity L-threonine aldolase [Bacteroidales bacterium]|nr:low specificity L-threonine aldolase [Bacteroidales bacterium]
MVVRKSFASDNNSGVHPAVIDALKNVNKGHELAYGDDPYTQKAINLFRTLLEESIDVYFVLTGTGANVLGIQSITKSYHSVICAESSHMQVDECGAPEKFIGCKMLPIETKDGKLTPDLIEKHLHGFGFEHHSQPKVISITQATELGTIYELNEIKQISRMAHSHGMFVHMDGARIANAAAALKVSLHEMLVETGVDVVSFGGTKNGLMYGEAIIFMNKALSLDFKYYRKQGMQLVSKMRYVAAQFLAYLNDDLWLQNATHANDMAQLLYQHLKAFKEIRITQTVQSNAIFAILPKEKISTIQKESFFYIWNEEKGEVRFVTSYDTMEEDVEAFIEILSRYFK